MFLPDGTRSEEESPFACQQRCQTVEACRYFSWYPDKGCHLHEANAVHKKQSVRLSHMPTVSGPRECDVQNEFDVSDEISVDVSDNESADDGTVGLNGRTEEGEKLVDSSEVENEDDSAEDSETEADYEDDDAELEGPSFESIGEKGEDDLSQVRSALRNSPDMKDAECNAHASEL